MSEGLSEELLLAIYKVYEETEGKDWKAEGGYVSADDGKTAICDSGDWGGVIPKANAEFMALAHQAMPALLAHYLGTEPPRQKQIYVAEVASSNGIYALMLRSHEQPTEREVKEAANVPVRVLECAPFQEKKRSHQLALSGGLVFLRSARKPPPKQAVPYKSAFFVDINGDQVRVEADGRDAWASDADGIIASTTTGQTWKEFEELVQKRCPKAVLSSFRPK